jgi:hypothetical protein
MKRWFLPVPPRWRQAERLAPLGIRVRAMLLASIFVSCGSLTGPFSQAGSPTIGAEPIGDFIRSFAVPSEGGELEIVNQIGMIRVTATPPGVEQMTIQARQGTGEARVRVQQLSSRKVKVEVSGRGQVDFEVRVPPLTRLDLLTFRGTISVIDHDGQVRARIASVGNIELSGLRSRQVEGHCHQGKVRFSGELQSQGDYSLKSYSGQVEVAIPEHADFRLLASTHEGAFDLSGFPMRYHQQDHDIVKAVSGSGRSNLYLWTQEGRIHLRRQL